MLCIHIFVKTKASCMEILLFVTEQTVLSIVTLCFVRDSANSITQSAGAVRL